MLTLEKIRKVAERLSEEKVTLKVDYNIKIRKWKNSIKIETPDQTSEEHLKECLKFYLPYLEIK